METVSQEPVKVEPPLGMYPGKLDDRGRVKLPSTFEKYISALKDKRLFVTSLDRRTAQIYPITEWRNNLKFFETYRENVKLARSVAFNANDLGAEAEMDSQGRVLFSPELRRALDIENQSVRLMSYRGRIEVMSEKMYEEQRREALEVSADGIATLEAAGMK